jgi:thiol-disulfide isomerase/thioredoxin
MLMDVKFLEGKFAHAHTYDQYVRTGTGEQQRRWKDALEDVSLTPQQRALLAGFVREMKVLVISGVWCGDCIVQCPMLQRVAEGNRLRVNLRFLDRDENLDLAEQVKVNSGLRVPLALFLAEDFELCSTYGERTLSRYRALAKERLGPACPTGIVPPGAAERSSALQEWLNEFERVQLLLRLSPRLRQKHGD